MVSDVVIVAAKRTPIGAFQGSFASVPAHELASSVIKVNIFVEDYFVYDTLLMLGCVEQQWSVPG